MLKIAERFMKLVRIYKVQEVMLFFKLSFIVKMEKIKENTKKIYFLTMKDRIYKIRGNKMQKIILPSTKIWCVSLHL